MTNFTLTLAVLCILSWILVSVSEFNTVEVQPGEEVTLTCSNYSKLFTHIQWFRLDRPNMNRISSMLSSEGNATLFDGFKNGRFNMTSNTTIISLNIKQVNFNDSGLYFCGFYENGQFFIFSATYLDVKEVDVANLLTVTVTVGLLAAFFMTAFAGLVVKIWQLHTGAKEEINPDRNETLGSSDLNSAALRFLPKTERRRRRADERAVETRVTYTVSR